MLVKIEIYSDGEFWCARGIGEDIFTQGSTLDELLENIKEALSVHFGDTTDTITILTLRGKTNECQSYLKSAAMISLGFSIRWITVPAHRVIAKGTRSDILTKISLWHNISKQDLLKILK